MAALRVVDACTATDCNKPRRYSRMRASPMPPRMRPITTLRRILPSERAADVRRLVRLALPLAVGLAGAWLGMSVWGASRVDMGPFVVRLDTQFGRGVTDIVLPPLGHLTANTHSAPLRLSATLLDVRISELTRELSAGGIDGLVARVQADSGHALPLHAFRVIAVAGFGALLLGALAFRTRWVPLVSTILIAMSLVGGSEILALATFQSGAFATPTSSGSLALAADIIPPVRSAATKFDEFRAQLERVVDGAIKVYTSIQTSPVGEAGEIRVLHISDIHLSPLGLEFAKQISDGFDVDFIVDTGDTTSFGTPPENVVLNNIASMGRPYVWVRGNHDSRAFQEAMEKLPNAIVLDGTLYLRVGTTGGSNFATFLPDEGIPLSAEVLYFEPGTPPRLVAYDLIEQSPKTGALTVTRHLVEQEFGTLTPSPSPSPMPSPTETGGLAGTASRTP